MMFVKKSVGSVYVGGYGGLSESGLYVFRELFYCSMWSCRMLIVVMMGQWSDDSAC